MRIDGEIEGEQAELLMQKAVQRSKAAIEGPAAAAMPAATIPPGTTPAPSVPAEKAAEAAEAAEAKKAARAHAAAEAKAKAKEQRDAYKKSDHYKAKQWLQAISNHMHTCHEEAAKCRDASCRITKGVAREYAASFDADLAKFEKLRAALEAVLAGESNSQLHDEMTGAEAMVNSFKTQLKHYNSLCRAVNK